MTDLKNLPLLSLILAAIFLTIACVGKTETKVAEKSPSPSSANTVNTPAEVDDGVTDGDKADVPPADSSDIKADEKSGLGKEADNLKIEGEKAVNKTKKTLETGANTGSGPLKKGIDKAVDKKP